MAQDKNLLKHLQSVKAGTCAFCHGTGTTPCSMCETENPCPVKAKLNPISFGPQDTQEAAERVEEAVGAYANQHDPEGEGSLAECISDMITDLLHYANLHDPLTNAAGRVIRRAITHIEEDN